MCGPGSFARINGKLCTRAGDLRPPAAFGLIWRGGPTLKLVVAYARNGWSTGYKFSVGVGYTIGTRR